MTMYALDDIDRQIIKFLAENGRTSNREIARRLNLTEGTIRTRIKRLEADEVVRVAAVVNVARLPKAVIVFLRIEVAPHFLVSDVMKNVAELPDTTIVASLIGRADVFAITYVKDSADLANYVHNTIDNIPGVLKVEYSVSYQIIKHDYRFTPGL